MQFYVENKQFILQEVCIDVVQDLSQHNQVMRYEIHDIEEIFLIQFIKFIETLFDQKIKIT